MHYLFFIGIPAALGVVFGVAVDNMLATPDWRDPMWVLATGLYATTCLVMGLTVFAFSVEALATWLKIRKLNSMLKKVNWL